MKVSKLEKDILQKIAENKGVLYKEAIQFHLKRDQKIYRETVNRLTTLGYIYEDKATYKLTPEGYKYLNPKRTWISKLAIGIGVIVISTLILRILCYFFPYICGCQ